MTVEFRVKCASAFSFCLCIIKVIIVVLTVIINTGDVHITYTVSYNCSSSVAISTLLPWLPITACELLFVSTFLSHFSPHSMRYVDIFHSSLISLNFLFALSKPASEMHVLLRGSDTYQGIIRPMRVHLLRLTRKPTVGSVIASQARPTNRIMEA